MLQVPVELLPGKQVLLEGLQVTGLGLQGSAVHLLVSEWSVEQALPLLPAQPVSCRIKFPLPAVYRPLRCPRSASTDHVNTMCRFASGHQQLKSKAWLV